MSAPAHDGWPQEGSVWEHWSDLLLATQLAALRSGFSGIVNHWDIRTPQKLVQRCGLAASSGGREDACTLVLLDAVAVDSGSLPGKWKVERLHLDNIPSSRHTRHVGGGIGQSKGYTTSPPKSTRLSKGKVISSFRKLHGIEAQLRAGARLDGRYLRAVPYRISMNEARFAYQVFCVVRSCSFAIRFHPHDQDDEGGWSCSEICTVHTCVTAAPVISGTLRRMLDFWAVLTKTDEYIGRHPVAAAGQDPRPRATSRITASPPSVDDDELLGVPADPILSKQLDSRQTKLSNALEALASVCQSIRNLQTKISLSDILDDTSDAVTLKKEMAELESAKSKIEKKVAKRKNKVRRQKLRVRYQQMLDKKVSP
ncbi:hypothetical protein JCM5353_000737 [Sporobolomyces roseus]